VLNGGRVRHAVPNGLLIAEEVVEGINARLGLEQEVAHRPMVGVDSPT